MLSKSSLRKVLPSVRVVWVRYSVVYVVKQRNPFAILIEEHKNLPLTSGPLDDFDVGSATGGGGGNDLEHA
jgi:hypothetical protein